MKRWEGTENEDIIINEQIQKGIEAIKEQRKRKEKTMTYFIDFIKNLLQKTLALHKHFFEMSNDLLKALKNRKNSL
ncbi:MAG TPA: hypothetical protein GXZ58_02285 [Bacilli bacterium]|nr:hypothetical protein [Bacilli bacterium]